MKGDVEPICRAICHAMGLCKYVGRCNTSRCSVKPDVAETVLAIIFADWDDLIFDVQEIVIGHIDTMYPGMWEGVPKSARLSIRNTIGNKLRAIIEKGHDHAG